MPEQNQDQVTNVAGQPQKKDEAEATSSDDQAAAREKDEIGGRDGPDPTRFGDWEKNGRCIDF